MEAPFVDADILRHKVDLNPRRIDFLSLKRTFVAIVVVVIVVVSIILGGCDGEFNGRPERGWRRGKEVEKCYRLVSPRCY